MDLSQYLPTSGTRLVGSEKKGWVSAKSIRATVKLENLFGTPARNQKVVGRISVRPTAFKFKEYENYTFNNFFGNKQKRPLQIEETFAPVKTDGLSGFDISLERFTQGTYRLDFSVEGFEAGGGRSVSTQNTVLLSPLPYLVGLKSNGPLAYINKDAEQSVELIAISDTLERMDKQELTIILKQIQHVSTLVKQKDGTYKYQTVDRETERKTEVMDISKDGTRYILPTSEPGDFVLEVLDESGIQLSRIQFTVVGHSNLAGRLKKSAELRLALNKKDYKSGEVIEMNITAPYVGSGLITIESDRVHAYKWFSANTQSTMETIVDEGILQVAGYKPPAPLDHFLRKRSLGVTTLKILERKKKPFHLLSRTHFPETSKSWRLLSAKPPWALPNRGKLQPLKKVIHDLPEEQSKDRTGMRLISPEACFLILDILKDNPQPQGSRLVGQVYDDNEIAWKTGTSFAFRDAWAVGISGPYVSAVWVGNFQDHGNLNFIGRQAAGPAKFKKSMGLRQNRRFAGSILPKYLPILVYTRSVPH